MHRCAVLTLFVVLGLAGAARAADPLGDLEPRTPGQLADSIAALRRPLGIETRFRHRVPRLVLRSSDVRFEGRVHVSVRVVRARR